MAMRTKEQSSKCSPPGRAQEDKLATSPLSHNTPTILLLQPNTQQNGRQRKSESIIRKFKT